MMPILDRNQLFVELINQVFHLYHRYFLNSVLNSVLFNFTFQKKLIFLFQIIFFNILDHFNTLISKIIFKN